MFLINEGRKGHRGGREEVIKPRKPFWYGDGPTKWRALAVITAGIIITAILLYSMIPGYGGGLRTPSATYHIDTTSVPNGVQLDIVSITKTDVQWSDVKIFLDDGVEYVEWSPETAVLNGGSAVSANLTGMIFDDLTIACWVFDVTGDGFVSGSDYLQVFTYEGASCFSSTTAYRLVLIWEPTSERIGAGSTFTG